MLNYLNETTRNYVSKLSNSEKEFIYARIQVIKSFEHKNFKQVVKNISVNDIKDLLA